MCIFEILLDLNLLCDCDLGFNNTTVWFKFTGIPIVTFCVFYFFFLLMSFWSGLFDNLLVSVILGDKIYLILVQINTTCNPTLRSPGDKICARPCL